ncbi:MAG: recombinase family protein [Bacteriovoracia bacterium]
MNQIDGGEGCKVYELFQLFDSIKITLLKPSQNPKLLRELRFVRKLSMSQMAKVTGHSRGHLKRQLLKFEIEPDKGDFGRATYGWSWDAKTRQLVRNEFEQTVIELIFSLSKGGMGLKRIARELNRRSILTKYGKKWWPQTVKNILRRKNGN